MKYAYLLLKLIGLLFTGSHPSIYIDLAIRPLVVGLLHGVLQSFDVVLHSRQSFFVFSGLRTESTLHILDLNWQLGVFLLKLNLKPFDYLTKISFIQGRILSTFCNLIH